MLRVLLLVIVVTLAAAGIVWLADNPGEVTILWLGAEIKLSIAVAFAGVALLAIAILIVWSVLRFLLRLPRLLATGARARRQEKGFEALSRGLVAVGSGDLAGAERYAAEARRKIGGHPLSLLLDAQAAQLAGDRPAALRAFHAMTETRPARLLGWRGVFIESQRAGDADGARRAAERAVEVAPSAAWANEAVLANCFARRDWAGARVSLERAERLRVIDRSVSKRQRAVLFAAEAQDAAAHDGARALELAREACRLAPDLVPAAALAGRLMGARGEVKKAARIIEAAWKAAPHPDLAQVYTHLRVGDSALDRLARAQTLARLAPNDPESRYAVAMAALDAREIALARENLDALAASAPTARICLAMADLAELDAANEGATRYWLSRAARAPRDKTWVADGVASDVWLPASPTGGRLDAFVWMAPPELISADPGAEAGPQPPQSDAALAPPASPPPAASQPIPASPVDAVAAPEPSPSPASPMAAPGAKPTPVIFPVAHAPDDPGARSPATGDRRWRVLNG